MKKPKRSSEEIKRIFEEEFPTVDENRKGEPLRIKTLRHLFFYCLHFVIGKVRLILDKAERWSDKYSLDLYEKLADEWEEALRYEEEQRKLKVENKDVIYF